MKNNSSHRHTFRVASTIWAQKVSEKARKTEVCSNVSKDNGSSMFPSGQLFDKLYSPQPEYNWAWLSELNSLMTEIILWRAFQKSREQIKRLVQGSWKNVSDLLLSLRQVLCECLLCKVTHTCRYQVRHVNKPGPYIWTSAFCHSAGYWFESCLARLTLDFGGVGNHQSIVSF